MKSNVRRFLRVVGATLAVLLAVAGAIAFALGRWIVRTFGYITPSQALMNLQGAETDGVGGGLTDGAYLEVIILPVLIVSTGILATLALGRPWRHIPGTAGQPEGGALRRPFIWLLSGVFWIAVPLAGAWSLGSALQVRDWYAAMNSDLDLGEYYAAPVVSPTESASEPLNLVVIYLESIEDALSDEEIFGRNLLAALDERTSDWSRVKYLEQHKDFGWTMSGIVGTQCGIPLRASSEARSSEDEREPAILNVLDDTSVPYLPEAICLGDVLAENGYELTFMGGAANTFANKGGFFMTHGYGSVLGREHWESENYDVSPDWWGVEDSFVLQEARNEALRLRATGKPFALTLLTLDSHEPAWELDTCARSSASPMEDLISCSSKHVASFVDFLEEEGFLEDTAVIIMGDHLRMAGEVDDKIAASGVERYIYNRIWTPGKSDLAIEKTDQFSMYPTMLEAAGFRLTDGRAGLGVSAYEPNMRYGTFRVLTDQEREDLVSSRSQLFYDGLWGVR